MSERTGWKRSKESMKQPAVWGLLDDQINFLRAGEVSDLTISVKGNYYVIAGMEKKEYNVINMVD